MSADSGAAPARTLRHNVPAVDLTGPWSAHPGDGELAKQFADRGFDDRAWTAVRLPHHWRTVDEFAAADGPVLYRRRLTAAGARSGRRAFVELDGIFYYGDVWFDGEYLGTTEGYFVPHTFEVTDTLRAASEHVLALEVACPPQRDRTAKRTVTGVFWHWDAADPTFNPGGPWRPIRIVETGRVRISTLRVLCTEALAERGRLTCDITLDATTGPLDAVLHAEVVGPNGEVLLDAYRPVTLAAGENRQSWVLSVDAAPRWWPKALGDQPLCTVHIAVESGDGVSDERSAAHGVPRDPQRRLEVLRQRRADVPQGHQPRADRHGTRRRVGRRDPPRPRPRAGREPRSRACPRARRRRGAVRRGRRARPARVAGPPAAVGLRPQHPHARPRARRG